MRRSFWSILGLLFLSSQNSFGAIVTVGFDSKPINWHTSVSDGGFDFAINGGNLMAIANSAFFGSPGPDNGTARYLVGIGSTPIVSVQASTGAAFSLLSFDLAEVSKDFPIWWANNVVVTGFLNGGGTVSTSIVPDFVHDGPGGVADFQTVLLPGTFTNLVSVQFAGTGPGANDFTLDNLAFETNEVPEPASLALIGIGTCITGLGALRRRRQSAATNL